MSRVPLTCCVASLVALGIPTLSAEDIATSFEDAIKSGSYGGMLRYRADRYDEENGASEYGFASTLRTSLYYQTKAFYGLTGFGELFHVASLGPARYSPQAKPKEGSRDFIIDPVGMGVNQAYARYQPTLPMPITVTAGRQLWTINDETLVTASRYRQNMNRFDAFTGSIEPLKNLTLEVGHIVHNIDVTDTVVPMHTDVANLAYAVPGVTRVAAYGVVLDYDDDTKTDRTTTGARLDGPFKIDDKFSVIYELDYATQKDSGDTKVTIDASMLTARAGLSYDQWYGSVGYRKSTGVSGSSALAYQSSDIGYPWPWRGNTEQLVFNPSNGLETMMVWIGGAVPKVDGLSFDVFYFDFKAAEDSTQFGTEISGGLNYNITKRWSVYGLATKGTEGDANNGAFHSANRLTGMTTFTF